MLDGPGEFVTLTLKVTPTDNNRFRYRYMGNWATLQLDRPQTVPWGHMVYLLGDPFYTGKDREIAYNNICLRAGVLPGMDLPYSMIVEDQDGDRISTVVDDPEGANALESKSDKLDPVAIRQAMISMQRRMADLERQLSESEAREAADPETPDLPKPSAKARASRRKDTTTRAAESPVPTINPDDHGSSDPSGGIIPDDMPTQLPVS
jgi:hypothetical protein